MQVHDHHKVQPSFTRINTVDPARLLLIGPIRLKVVVRRVRRNVEGVVSVSRNCALLCPFNPCAVLTHWSTTLAVPDIRLCSFRSSVILRRP